ncbi:FkbM family methyltransferase [Sinorhizobium medicae]|nr:FkbM family methyltransferase [Sinorhizobium medicae]MDX0846293.1 FkbM family methyltransferase [Sinorhizobium medicae]
MDNNTIVLTDQGRSYQMFLPDHATDYIQKKVAETGTPYELDMLRDMGTRLSPGDLVLDIGANIGNHSLYLAAVYACDVIAFEPNAHLANSLVQSAKFNDLDARIKVIAKGVGAEPGLASFSASRPENLGAQSLVQGHGDIPVVRLDDQNLEKQVKLIKIDVEGMELAVLRGAEGLIARDRPVLYVESTTESAFRELMGLLQRQNYLVSDTFNATPTHLFLPAESVTIEQHLRHVTTRKVLESYRNAAELATLRETLNNANLKYRMVTQQLAEARRSLSAAASKAETADEALQENQTELQSQMTALRDERDALSDALHIANMKCRVVTKQLAGARESLHAATTTAETTARQIKALRLEVAELEARLQERFSDIAPPPDRKGGSSVSPEMVASWILALPLSPTDAARRFAALSDRIRPQFPDQALALIRAAYELDPSPRIARKIGFALVETGAAEDALKILKPVLDGLNFSSREDRLLKLAREGHDATTLKVRASRAVRSSLRVAAIMDEFTYTGYAAECDLQQLSPGNWETELEDFRPELLLVESAWRGLNEEWGPKVGKLSGEVKSVLEWCRTRNVPTAFWNKEDPVHFDTFLTTAQRFDVIFTTDIDCIPRYKAALGHDRVHLLPFACQPEIHNPLEIGTRKDAFCFAGAYYVRYPDRTRDLDDFLDKLSGYRPFEIFDRNFGKDLADYMFPEAYQKYIVGTLPPSEIDRAYKGYTFGINLNSVKNSQSMYARRVYELLASNTRIISNYSRGLRLMFGDLVVSTDSGEEALRRVRKQDEMGFTARLRLAGLRKVLSEHTYGHRLARVAHHAGLDIPDACALAQITLLAQANTQSEVESLIAQVRRQKIARLRLVLVLPAEIDLPEAALPCPMRRMTPEDAAGIRLGDLVASDEWVAGFVPGDYYGANYLTDLILATRYSDTVAIGKAAYHRMDESVVALVDGPSYVSVDRLASRRSLLRGDQAPAARLDRWLEALPEAILEGPNMLALDPFGYCEGGALKTEDEERVKAAVEDFPGINVGMAEADLAERADAMTPAPDVEINVPLITGAALIADMPKPGSGKITWITDGKGDCRLTSTLGDENHLYIYERKERPLSELRGEDGRYRLHPLVGPGLNTEFVAVWLDAQRQKLGHQMLHPNRNARLKPSEGTEFVRFGIRLRGPGSCAVHGILLGDRHPAPRPILSGSKLLLLTNHYPSYQHLYRNGFVHSRVRAYRELGGITPDIYRLRPEQDLSWHEFQNIDCMTGSAEQLDLLLGSGQYDHVLVHFLDEPMWRVLERYVDKVRVTVWVHGAEVQPWWRRTFNYSTEEELERAKTTSDLRLGFWRRLFAPLPKNLRFIFVSQYFANEVFADLEVVCPADQYQIIHNPIDDQLFAYHEKPVEQRGKILSIRPFASAKYANDLSVKAILALQKREFFNELEFRIVGDGPQFEEITAPLLNIPNVTCEKRFLTQLEIAALHREYGVFLNPTRMDAQGVSRDEAMSSGLVPVTSRVAAIPEFVDDACGYMAEAEDADGLACAIVDLWTNPETFLRKSQAAAERVRGQSAKEKIIMAELTVIA